MSLSRPTASKYARKLSCTAVACLGLLSLSAAPALAKKDSSKDTAPVVKEATAAVNAVLAVCPGQTFAQPFASSGDLNYYTLVEGSEFNSSSEGWELTGGAHIVSTTRPDGSVGSALDLPSGSAAISPAVCVTLQYPTARVYTNTVQGKSNLVVSVAYPGTLTASKPKQVGAIQEEQNGNYEGDNGKDTSWALSTPFNVQPELGGKVEETRQARFIFVAGGKGSDTQLYGLYVDPRMR
jgi:hypothetical protein